MYFWLVLLDLLREGQKSVSPRKLADEAAVSLEVAQNVIKDAYKLELLK
jgi:hypothetical protein